MPDCGRFNSHQFWSKIPRAPLPSQTLSVSPEGPPLPLLVLWSHCGRALGAKAGVYACASLSTNLDVSIPLSLVSPTPRGLEVAPRFPLGARPRPPKSLPGLTVGPSRRFFIESLGGGFQRPAVSKHPAGEVPVQCSAPGQKSLGQTEDSSS